jgi:hypothetical protein
MHDRSLCGMCPESNEQRAHYYMDNKLGKYLDELQSPGAVAAGAGSAGCVEGFPAIVLPKSVPQRMEINSLAFNRFGRSQTSCGWMGNWPCDQERSCTETTLWKNRIGMFTSRRS